MNRLTLEQLDVQPRDRVLEVGFGGGDLLANALAITRAEIVGIDISEAMVARAPAVRASILAFAKFKSDERFLALVDAISDYKTELRRIRLTDKQVATFPPIGSFA